MLVLVGPSLCTCSLYPSSRWHHTQHINRGSSNRLSHTIINRGSSNRLSHTIIKEGSPSPPSRALSMSFSLTYTAHNNTHIQTQCTTTACTTHTAHSAQRMHNTQRATTACTTHTAHITHTRTHSQQQHAQHTQHTHTHTTSTRISRTCLGTCVVQSQQGHGSIAPKRGSMGGRVVRPEHPFPSSTWRGAP